MRNSFVLYTQYSLQMELLTMEQRGILFTAIMNHVQEKPLPQMDAVTQMAFVGIQRQLDEDNEKYQKTVDKRKAAGKLGGRPKADDSSEKQTEAKKANGFSEKQTEAKKPDNDNVNDNDNDNVNDNNKTYTCAFEELWKAYPRKKEKAGAYKCYKARLADGFSEDELFTAVKRYAEECRRNKTEQRFIKHAATFLGPNTPFMDYLKREEDSVNERSDSSLKLW